MVALAFLINDGALVCATGDDALHMWTLRQKTPQILHSLKFQRERYVREGFCHAGRGCGTLWCAVVGRERLGKAVQWYLEIRSS